MISIDLLKSVEEARNNGKKIGLVQGSWDLFHLGHLKYIKKAKELCDYLIIAMDGDEKIRKRKGPSRPIIPETERYEFMDLLDVANYIVIKDVNEAKWELIKAVKPDVLVAIKDNYSDEDIVKLEQICGRVAILPRQSESSTSDKIRKATMAIQAEKVEKIDGRVKESIVTMKKRLGLTDEMEEPIAQLFEHIQKSTDWVCPVAVGCYYNEQWYVGTNKIDLNLSQYDIDNRTELFYSSIEHAEINLLKQLGEVSKLDAPIYTTLFPCDKCMKVLKDKGVKEIYYLEDHPERNWSKRSHAIAAENDIKTINLLREDVLVQNCENEALEEQPKFQFIYPPNARNQEQLDIMMELESAGKDPLDPEIIDQEILFTTEHWYVSANRFPYPEIEHQFMIAARNPIYKKEDMSKEMWVELKEIWLRLAEEYNISGGALCYRFGDPKLSGASLTRLHAHLIMPKLENKTKFTIGGNSTLKAGLEYKHKLPQSNQ